VAARRSRSLIEGPLTGSSIGSAGIGRLSIVRFDSDEWPHPILP